MNITTVLLLIAIAVTSKLGMAASAEEILRRTDDVRNPALSYRLKVEIETPGEELSEFEIDIKGKDKTISRSIKPVRDRGRSMLMIGEDMWAYVPNLKRAVRISLNQKLTGQAANGDICRQRWSGDYSVTIEREDKEQWVLLLTAKVKNLTYDKIRLFVEKKLFHPKKAEYLTKNNKLLKYAKFEGYKMLRGALRPSRTLITSAVNETDTSLIRVIDMEPMEFPDSKFDQNSLK